MKIVVLQNQPFTHTFGGGLWHIGGEFRGKPTTSKTA
jgi:hypothetical protein